MKKSSPAPQREGWCFSFNAYSVPQPLFINAIVLLQVQHDQPQITSHLPHKRLVIWQHDHYYALICGVWVGLISRGPRESLSYDFWLGRGRRNSKMCGSVEEIRERIHKGEIWTLNGSDALIPDALIPDAETWFLQLLFYCFFNDGSDTCCPYACGHQIYSNVLPPICTTSSKKCNFTHFLHFLPERLKWGGSLIDSGIGWERGLQFSNQLNATVDKFSCMQIRNISANNFVSCDWFVSACADLSTPLLIVTVAHRQTVLHNKTIDRRCFVHICLTMSNLTVTLDHNRVVNAHLLWHWTFLKSMKYVLKKLQLRVSKLKLSVQCPHRVHFKSVSRYCLKRGKKPNTHLSSSACDIN